MSIKVTLPKDFIRFKKEEFWNLKSYLRSKRKGVYLLYGNNRELLYVGKSSNIAERIYNHITGQTNTCSFHKKIKQIKIYFDKDDMNIDIYETYLINKLKPRMNKSKVYDSSENVDLELEDKLAEVEGEIWRLTEEKRELVLQIREIGEFNEDDYEDCSDSYHNDQKLGENLILQTKLAEIMTELDRQRAYKTFLKNKLGA